MIKKLLLILLLAIGTIQGSEEYDTRLNNYPDAKADYQKAVKYKDQSAAFDLALFYENNLQDNQKAIRWYKKSYNLGSERAAYNLGLVYDLKEQEYKCAIKWYLIAYEHGVIRSANNLGYLFDKLLKDEEKATYWYKEGAKNGNPEAINNLSKFYYEKGEKTTSSAYVLAMINYGFTKEQVLSFLKDKRKINKDILKKAYKLQQTLDIPKHYTGGID